MEMRSARHRAAPAAARIAIRTSSASINDLLLISTGTKSIRSICVDCIIGRCLKNALFLIPFCLLPTVAAATVMMLMMMMIATTTRLQGPSISSIGLRAGYLSVRTAGGASDRHLLKARLTNGLTYLLTYLL